MKHSPVASQSLWCRRDEDFFQFEVAISAPYQIEDLWLCDWSLGKLFPKEVSPARNVSSLTAVTSAIGAITTFLVEKQRQGHMFYLTSSEEELIPNMTDLFMSDIAPL